MCTAIVLRTNDTYFGRTLDYDFSYGEQVVITPRNYLFKFRNKKEIHSHYAFIGMAHVSNNYPLYYEAFNEKGLAIAGLNFVSNAYYYKEKEDKDNIAQFEFIPWILCQCQNIDEVMTLLNKINIIDDQFSNQYPVAKLHWIISDHNRSVIVESTIDGLNIYEDDYKVLTNDPCFLKQIHNLKNYLQNNDKLPLGFDSKSRFIKAYFAKNNSINGKDEDESVNQFFHIMSYVFQQKGINKLDNGNFQYTIYTSCCNLNQGIYYYTTYYNHQINRINLFSENLDSNKLITYSLIDKESFNQQN